VRSAHRAFREALVSELLKNPSPKALKQVYVTEKTKLPEIRLTRPIEIHQRGFGKRTPCVFCRWSQVTKKGRSTQVITKSQNIYIKLQWFVVIVVLIVWGLFYYISLLYRFLSLLIKLSCPLRYKCVKVQVILLTPKIRR
jgi:hypothetical protein